MEFERNSSQAAILDRIRRESPVNRVSLAKALHLSKVTVSSVINEFIDDGLIVEIGEGTGGDKGGRKPIQLGLNASYRYAVGLDIGTTNTVAAIGNLKGEFVAKIQRPTSRDRSSKSVFEQAMSLIEEVIATSGIDRAKILGVGISVPGLVETETGVIRTSPDFNWDNIEINKVFQDMIGMPIVSDNCTRAMLLGARWHDKAREGRNVFFINIGYGVGSALAINDQIYSSHSEFGHIHVSDEPVRCHCGKFGCLEAVASGSAIERAANNSDTEDGSDSWITADRLAEQARNGSYQARQTFDEVGRYMGKAIAIAANMFNPDKVILGGGVTLAFDLMQDSLNKEYEKHAMSVIKSSTAIEVSQLGMDAGAYGAIALALKKFFYQVGVEK
ncbi:MAG: ROK family transcriptional regulator [Rhodospirillales bacterium]|nr:ROK family transcriptional regulator [Rhodospirillales bacterium]